LRLTSSNSKSSDVINLAVVYRPPSTDLSDFYDDLSSLFDKFGDVIDRDQFICCGDFNCGGDGPTTTSPDLQSVFEAHGLQQLVKSPTRRTSKKSSLLDLVVCRANSMRVSHVEVRSSHEVSDHDCVTWSLHTRLKTKPILTAYKFRQLKNVDWTIFDQDLQRSELFSHPAKNVDEFADQIDAVTLRLLNHHCPLQERKRFMSTSRDNRWLSQTALDAKRQRRKLERQWKTTGRADHYVAYPLTGSSAALQTN